MDILAINPRRKRKAKKRGETMPVRKRRRNEPNPNPRRRRRRYAATTAITHTRRRRNPTGAQVAAYGRGTLAGINVGGALKSSLPLLVGALAAKFAAKKFTADDGSEGANWTWKNYGFSLLGGFVAAVATSAIFKSRLGAAQKVMEGAFLITGYKIFVNEIASQNATLNAWFSADEPPLMLGQDQAPVGQLPVQPGAIVQGDDGQPYVMGQDGMWRPVSEDHRLPAGYYGDSVVPVRADMGDGTVPVRADMGEDLAAKFKRAYQ
jgi:hypothetical protein